MLLSPHGFSLVHLTSTNSHPEFTTNTHTHTKTHTHTHPGLYVDHRHTSAHTPAPPQSLIYSYLMLWCHNSLSGSFAWQPFATRCSRGGKKKRTGPVCRSPHCREGIGLRQTHTHTHTLKRRTPFYLSSWHLPPCCADWVRGIRLTWQPLPATRRAPRDPAEKSGV